MESITVNLKSDIKKGAKIKAKADGLTLTFVVTQVLKAYAEGKIQFGVFADDDITESFDVSTKAGKKACIKSFESLMS